MGSVAIGLGMEEDGNRRTVARASGVSSEITPAGELRLQVCVVVFEPHDGPGACGSIEPPGLSQSLSDHEPHEAGVPHKVSLPHASWFLKKPEEPLKTRSLHPLGRPLRLAGPHVETAANTDGKQRAHGIQIVREKELLAWARNAHKEESCA